MNEQQRAIFMLMILLAAIMLGAWMFLLSGCTINVQVGPKNWPTSAEKQTVEIQINEELPDED
jgi:outer membrane biogenesis lipoprotein LolB